MNKLDQIKLEIYERCNKGEISEEDRNILLEKAEERYNDFLLNSEEELLLESVLDGYISFDEIEDIITEKEGNDKSQSANKIYINAFKKTVGEYRREVNDIKKIINKGNKGDIISRIKKSEKSLMDLKKMVSETPSTLPENMISLLIPMVASLGAITIFSSIKKSEIEKNYREKDSKLLNKNENDKKALNDAKNNYDTSVMNEEIIRNVYMKNHANFSFAGSKEFDKRLKQMEKYQEQACIFEDIIKKKEKDLAENFAKLKENMTNNEKEKEKESKKAQTSDAVVIGSTVILSKKVNLFKSFAILCINHELKHLKKLESTFNNIYK